MRPALASSSYPGMTSVGFHVTLRPPIAYGATSMKATEKFSISMPLDMASDLRATVEAGEFSSTSEAIRDAVRVWRRQRLEDADRLTLIRARIRRSIDDPRPALTPEEVAANLDALASRLEAEHASANATIKG